MRSSGDDAERSAGPDEGKRPRAKAPMVQAAARPQAAAKPPQPPRAFQPDEAPGLASSAGPKRQRPKPPTPFAGFEWWIAGRYLRAKRKENFASIISIISFLGIMLGVATLITVMAVMNGFRTDLMNRILGLNGHMVVQQSVGPLTDYDGVVADIMTVPGVTQAAPVVEGGVMAVRDGQFSYAMVRGFRLADLQAQPLVADNIIAGSLDSFENGAVVALGNRAAARFGVSVGDRITLISPRGAATPFGTAPRQKAYEIGALFNVGMSQFDESFIFMPMAEAQKYFSTGPGVTQVEVMIADPEQVKRYRIPILEAAGADKRIIDWQQVNASLVSALQVERTMMFIILSLIIIVAALNIISGLVMLVKDKGRDIAVLRTMGATKGAILRVFLISGASIGVVGTLAGFALGLVLCFNIEAIRQFISSMLQTDLFSPEVYFLSKMTAEINNGEVIAVLAFALALSLLAPLYPAWRAARLDPVEALRYE